MPTILALPDAGAVQTTDSLILEQSGGTKKVSALTLATAFFAEVGGESAAHAAATYETQVHAAATYTAIADLANSSDPAKGSALVGFLPLGAGAVGRTVQSKSGDIISAFDFMSTAQIADVKSGAASIDVSAALNLALAAAHALSAGSTTDPYGARALGGAIVYLPPGRYLCTANKLLFYENTGIRGAGQRSSIIVSSFDGRIIEGQPSAQYTAFGMLLEDFGILGDRTKISQVGISLMRPFGAQVKNVEVLRCGSHGIQIKQALLCNFDNVETQMNVGVGLSVMDGTTSWSDTTPTNFPSNTCVFTDCHFAFNDSEGVLLSQTGSGSGVNGCVFNGCVAEYNYSSSVAGTGYNVRVTCTSIVPNEFDVLWTEGPVKSHVYLNTTVGNSTRISRWHHFGGGAASYPERALIVDGGTAYIDESFGHSAQYRTVAGSKAPFRLNKAGGIASIRVKDAFGSTVTGNLFVEDETGATVGLHNYLRMTNFGQTYGLSEVYVDSGVNGPSFYQAGQSSPIAEFSNFYAGLGFGAGVAAVDAYIVRLAAHALGPRAGDRLIDQLVSADRGDTSQTLTVGTDNSIQRWATALTANRIVTLSTTGATNGDKFRVVRTGLGAFNLDVGGLKTIVGALAAFVDVSYDGAAWRLTGYGTL